MSLPTESPSNKAKCQSCQHSLADALALINTIQYWKIIQFSKSSHFTITTVVRVRVVFVPRVGYTYSTSTKHRTTHYSHILYCTIVYSLNNDDHFIDHKPNLASWDETDTEQSFRLLFRRVSLSIEDVLLRYD